jgi:hypothetical protein
LDWLGRAVYETLTVGNTVTDPVRVRNVNDAIQPVQVANSCTSPNLTLGCSIGPFFYHVPAGKRLVIEFVSMQVCSLPGQSASMNILTIVGGSGANHSSTETPPSTSPGTEFIGCNIPSASSSTAVGEQVHLYADPDTFISVGSSRDNNAGAAFFQFTMSGYLVEVPFTP